MLLRRRISIVAALTVAAAVAVAMLASYFIVRGRLISQIDSELIAQAQRYQALGVAAIGPHTRLPANSANGGANAPYVELVNRAGQTESYLGGLSWPSTRATVAVAKGTKNGVLATAMSNNGFELRTFAFHAVAASPDGYSTPVAIVLARPLGPVQSVLASMRLILSLLFITVVALAALLARLATRRVLRPLAEVTATAQLIGETDDLSRRLTVDKADEVGQLAARFNEMLERLETSRAALDLSVSAQRQLVADASHELRTPVTSLRTNVEVLLSGAELEAEDRERLLRDVVEQSEELSNLVSDLIEVARGDTPPAEPVEIRLDQLVEEALDRARRNAPAVRYLEQLEPVTVSGDPDRLARAINNLLDNAALHAGHGGPVEVTVDSGGVTVRDHGDGISDEDLPHIFDRFYRGARSRARQGSGLGLAIVSQTATQHGGQASAENAPDGGALFRLSLPCVREPERDGPAPVLGDPAPARAAAGLRP
jgi:two-component system sensor histidine kinase MprB